MQFKAFLFSIILIALSGTMYAQDKIYQTNGDIIDAKIKSVGVRTITYQRFDNQTGPEYTIDKMGVDKIVYQNGSEDAFGGIMRPGPHLMHHRSSGSDDEGKPSKINYNRNVIALAPFQFSENGLGFGLSYERALDKNGVIAFYMPALMTWNLNSGTYVDNNGNRVNGNVDPMFYAMPGIKLYPTGSFCPVKYSVGPSLVIASGTKSQTISTGSYPYSSSYISQDHFILGMIINNSLNINPSPHIFLGLEVGMGFTYLNRLAGLNQDTQFLAQGGFKIGYRF